MKNNIENEIKSLFIDLKELLNHQCTKRTLEEDFCDIADGLEDLKERIDDSENKNVFEEDKICLGWALDFMDYLYKIYKVVEQKGDL